MTLVEFFDPHNSDHIKAYNYLTKTGAWPEGFVPDHIEIPLQWQVGILEKLAKAWIQKETK